MARNARRVIRHPFPLVNDRAGVFAGGAAALRPGRRISHPAAGDQPAWQFGPGTVEGHAAGSVVASYLHTHWAGHPAAAARFTAACEKVPAV